MTSQPAETKSNKFLVITLPVIISLIILIGFLSWLLFFAPEKNFLTQLPGVKQSRQAMPQYQKETFPEVTASPDQSTVEEEPTRAPKPIGTGRKGFTISSGKQNVPQFGKNYLDPIDPDQDSQQEIIIAAENSVPIDNVQVTIKTDNKETPVEMKLAEGTEADGIWEGSWTVDDTYLYNYKIEVVASAANGEQKATLTLR